MNILLFDVCGSKDWSLDSCLLLLFICTNLNSEDIISNFDLSVFDHILPLFALDFLKNKMHLFYSLGCKLMGWEMF